MKRFLLLAMLVALNACGDDDDHRRPTPTATATVALTATATTTLTATATAPPTATASPSATASATPTATSTPDALRLPDLHAEPDPVGGGRIVDAEGREVLLRGVNVNAFAEYWAYGDFPTVFPFTAADADAIAAIGWNTVRLLLSWSRVEPAPGTYDTAYLEEIRGAVRLLASRGIYTILDLHQDAWGPTLVAPPGEMCAPDTEPAFGWDGAPGWATLDDGAARCTPAGIRELSPAVRAAFVNFFADAPGPGGVGIRTRYVAMLAAVAGALAAEPGVAGYDLMNEPNAFTPDELAALADLYADAIVAIRAAEAAAGSPPRLVFFEPGAAWAVLNFGATPDFARDANVVYAPHLYQGGLDDQALAPQFARARSEAALYGGAPVLTGEWGSDPRRASDPSGDYFREHQRLQDETRIGATLWTWRESCGDPHKAGDARAGRVPYVWGEFEVDCTTNTVTGPRQDLIDELTRGYVRAAPGYLLESTWDADEARLLARGTGTTAAELLIVYPGPAEPTVADASGLSDLRAQRGPGDLWLITGDATGPWQVTVAP